jgi:hypothetical protein
LSTEVEHNNIDMEKERDRIDWRRSKVQELSSQGHSQRDKKELKTQESCTYSINIIQIILGIRHEQKILGILQI